MASHVFHEIYLHFNWHVKHDQPTLRDEIERAVHQLLEERCRKLKGVFLHGVGGTETHIHMAINIEPSVTISELVKNLKGGSAHDLNERVRQKTLEWQRGYGVVSFGRRNLPWVLDYIAHQKEHHAAGRVFDRLERCDCDEGEGDSTDT